MYTIYLMGQQIQISKNPGTIPFPLWVPKKQKPQLEQPMIQIELPQPERTPEISPQKEENQRGIVIIQLHSADFGI